LQALLRDLVGMLNPLDAGQLRRLARTHARAGSMAEATRLYRWCATQTQSSSPFAFSAGVRPLSANDLVKEVKETLEKDELLSVIEAILEFADPGEDRWAREGYESLVMETWEEMYGPEVALEKTRAMCTAASDPKTGLRRRTSKRAAYLYARNGDLDRAIECLELGLCKLDPALFESDDPYWRFYPENIGSLSSDDLRRLFPVDCSEWPSASAWLRRCAGALEGWLADERIGESNTAMALALIARRLSALGEIEEAQRVAGVLDTILDLSPEMELWVADAAREVGLPERGDAIERELLEAGKLGIGRLPEVVQHVLETEGPEIAMKLGQAAAELTLHPDLLEVLVRAAEAAQDEARAEHWRSMMESVEQARARLEQLDEEAEHGTGEPKAAARWAR
jgi:tetratricopeptide (TPR) repeat protein